MGLFKTAEEKKRYHASYTSVVMLNYITSHTGDYETTDEQLTQWANDDYCIEKELCAQALIERQRQREEAEAKRKADAAAEQERLAAKRQKLLDNPFDPRTEVSADAQHIASRVVTHMWIILVLLPFVIGVMLAIVSSALKG